MADAVVSVREVSDGDGLHQPQQGVEGAHQVGVVVLQLGHAAGDEKDTGQNSEREGQGDPTVSEGGFQGLLRGIADLAPEVDEHVTGGALAGALAVEVDARRVALVALPVLGAVGAANHHSLAGDALAVVADQGVGDWALLQALLRIQEEWAAAGQADHRRRASGAVVHTVAADPAGVVLTLGTHQHAQVVRQVRPTHAAEAGVGGVDARLARGLASHALHQGVVTDQARRALLQALVGVGVVEILIHPLTTHTPVHEVHALQAGRQAKLALPGQLHTRHPSRALHHAGPTPS